MNQVEKERLIQECTKFRNAIEQCKYNMENLSWFKDFPRGCCGNTSEMLGKFLYHIGYKKVKYVWCDFIYGVQSSHAWLILEGMTIDITADQFDEIEEKILVVSKSAFHERLEEIQVMDCKDIRLDADLMKAYNKILEKINVL